MNKHEKLEIVKRHCAALMEHFNSVQIIAVTQHSRDGSTASYVYGEGSWYERFGALREAVTYFEEYTGKRANPEEEA